MKKFVIIIGVLSIALNTISCLILSGYDSFNCLLADVSLLSSAVMLYITADSKISIGFKIGLTVFFFITGLVRYLCMVVTSNIFVNNVLLIVALGILFFEIVCISAACLMIPNIKRKK